MNKPPFAAESAPALFTAPTLAAPKQARKPRTPKLPDDIAEAFRSDPTLVAKVRRLITPPAMGETITTPAELYRAIYSTMFGQEREILVAVALDRRRRVVDIGIITVGSDAFTIVDPKQVLRWALSREKSVSAIAIAHNHPSGDPEPSAQDADVTDRMARASRVLGIPLVDHLVFTDSGYVSLAERGLVPLSSAQFPAWTQ